MNPILPVTALLLALSGSAFAASPDADTTLGLAARADLDRDGLLERAPSKSRGGARAAPASRGAPAARPAPSASRGAPAARPAAPAARPAPSAAPSRGPAPAHAAPAPSRGAAPAHAAPAPSRGAAPAHATPAPARPPRGDAPPADRHTSARPADQDVRAAQAHTRTYGDRPASARPAPVQPRHVAPRPAPRHAPHVVVHHHPRPVYVHRVRYVRPYHGVFVYGPRPVYHTGYAGRQEVEVEQAHLPTRKVDREDTLAVGAFGGSYIGGYDSAAGYADPGLGLNVRYRPDETVGLEVALSHFGMESDDSARATTVGQASVQLFAYPWTRVSPFVSGGLTMAPRDFRDAYFDESADQVRFNDRADVAFGPHVGLGVEFALGKTVAIDLEARYTALLGQGASDPTSPGSLQTRAGLVFHFN